MSYFSSLLFAVSASLDAFIVGITYGIRKVHIPLSHNILVSLITLAGTVLSIFLGCSLSPLFSGELAAIAGSAILIGMGAYYLLKFLFLTLRRRRNTDERSRDPGSCCSGNENACGCPTDNEDSRSCCSDNEGSHCCRSGQCAEVIMQASPGLLSRKELLLMGIALSLNNMGIGIGASIAGLPLLPASICTFLCSVCFLMLGNLLGKAKLLQIAGHYSEPLSGLLLIGLGIYELL